MKHPASVVVKSFEVKPEHFSIGPLVAFITSKKGRRTGFVVSNGERGYG